MSERQSEVVKVGLSQINNSYSYSGENHYLPLSVGYLQAYVQEHAKQPERFHFLPMVFKRAPVRESVAQLVDADIVGFSIYAWNGEMSLEIARRLKAIKPETLIVFGGPHVPEDSESFLRSHSFIDVAVHNEGERTFLSILEMFPERNWTDIQSISYINSASQYCKNTYGPRFKDLTEVPSPYLNGIFDSLILAHPQINWIVLWETNRGCPFQCTFCDWGSATAAKLNRFEEDRLKEEINWFSKHKVGYIFCCDANFGILQRDVDISEYVAAVKRDTQYPNMMFVQSTKNATDRAYLTQKILNRSGLSKGVALSMQSMDENTLASIKRDNISLETFMEMQKRFTKDKIETYSDLILALPGETYDSLVKGIDLLVTRGQHNRINFNNLAILPNAEMGDPAYQAKYGMKTVRSNIGTIHGTRNEMEDDVPENQDLVIETESMPADDWCRARAYCWMVALLHFNKLMQIPIILVHENAGVPYGEMFQAFMEANKSKYPTVSELTQFFLDEAKAIQNGGPVFKYSEEWLGINWHPDEYAFIDLTVRGKIDAFYTEASDILTILAEDYSSDLSLDFIAEAATLNRALLKQPFLKDDVTVNSNYDIMSFYDDIRCGETSELRKSSTSVKIDRTQNSWDDFDKWLKEGVWLSYSRGAFLYDYEVMNENSNRKELVTDSAPFPSEAHF